MAEQKGFSFKPGVWQGKYLDAYGYRGDITFSTELKGEEISGKFELVLSTEDQPQTITGAVSGKHAEGSVHLRLTIGRIKEPIEYDAQIINAGSHAEQCMSGLVTAPKNSNFGGGVWIAWLFKGGTTKNQ